MNACLKCFTGMLLCCLSALLIAAEPQPVFQLHPRTWYGDVFGAGIEVSSDGLYALYYIEGDGFLRDLSTGVATPIHTYLSAERLGGVVWDSKGSRLQYTAPGSDGPAAFMMAVDNQKPAASDWPIFLSSVSFASDHPVRLANYRDTSGQRGYWLDNLETGTSLPVVFDQPPIALALAPSGEEIAFLATDISGSAELKVRRINSGKTETVRQRIDTTYYPQQLAWSVDGETIFLNMVGPESTAPIARQQAIADRRLKIYGVNRRDGSARLIHEGESDLLLVGRSNDALYWVESRSEMSVAIFDLNTRQLNLPAGLPNTSLPFWHPSGQRLSVTYGDWRLADWVLNWDLGTLELESDGRLGSTVQPLILGYHEDYGLNWSPDGSWLAYHSHRSGTPATSYAGHDSTDDIYLRASPQSEEIRLTSNVGHEVGHPDWAPDGERLVFTAMDDEGVFSPWIIRIDPQTGESTAVNRLNVEGIDGSLISASWSPARPELAIEQSPGDGRRQLLRVSEDGAEVSILAEYRVATQLSWIDYSPDGNFIYFSALAEDHHQLFRVHREGGQMEQLTQADWELIQPQVSPDGQRIALTRFQNTKTLQRKALKPIGQP